MNGTEHCPHCGKPVPASALQGLCPECLLKAGASPTGEAGPNGTRVAPPPTEPPPAPTEIAKHFPQLEVLGCLGRGGMGVVYKARQPRLNRLVALKILAPEKGKEPAFAERFEREAQALARLSHPNIVTVHDFGQVDGMFYLLMEFVDGLNLRELLRAGRVPPEQALAIVPRICEALQFAHEHGVVHRDIKPENILLDTQGRVKIADFGIAKLVGGEQSPQALTQAEQVIGTPHYMAPEQVEHPQRVDHRADIYSLGVVFYEMLTGELPLGKFAPPSRKVLVDVRLDEVVLHALEKEPERRYQHASEVKTDVETIVSSPALRGAPAAPAPALRDSMRFRTGYLPELLPGETVVHVKRRLWAVFNKSLPTWRLFFSLPPLWEAGLYVTDRRLLLISHFLGLLGQEFSIWFPGRAPAGEAEFLRGVTVGRSRWLGSCLDLKSECLRKRWYRSRELLLRLYVREPELLCDRIAAAQASPAPALGGAQTQTAGAIRAVESRGVIAARWTARVLGTLLLAFYGFFVLAEGLPPLASQPEGVQLNFAALSLMLMGFVVGWKRDGPAALLIASGWTLWQISGGQLRWNLFQTPLPVGLLYAFCWWATRGRKTGTVVAVSAGLATVLGAGMVLLPANVHIRGVVRDAATGQPVPHAELAVLRQPPRPGAPAPLPNARAFADGRFFLYVGWYADHKPLWISATGYTTLRTSLGPRPFGQRRFERDFQLAKAGSANTALPAQEPTLGPVIERQLNDVDEHHGHECLVLETGELLNFPADEDFKRLSRAEQEQWFADHQVNALADTVGGQHGLGLRGATLARVANEVWERAMPAELAAALRSGDAGVPVKSRQGFQWHLLPTNAPPPFTFALRTDSGRQGLLQITALLDAPGGLKLRYRLGSSAGPSAEAAKQPRTDGAPMSR
jgi:tRNA A-37 threonylcarbamoyl transferase component Bud32